MNTFVLIGLVLLLVGVLVTNRRRRAAEGPGTSAIPSPRRPRRGLRRQPEAPSQGLSAPSSFPEASSFGDPSPLGSPSPFDGPAPFDRPAPYRESPPAGGAVPAPAAVAEYASPPPAEVADWTPEETIVEPGWPMPGEIAGAWASAPAPAAAAYGQGPAVAEWETAATATASAIAQTPAPGVDVGAAMTEAAEAWELPPLGPIAHEADAPAPDAPLWVPEAPAAQEPAPLWEPEAPAAQETAPLWEPQPSSPVAEAPAWAPEAPVHEPWDAAPAAGPVVTDPDPEPEPEPEVVWAAAPMWAPAHDAEPEAEPEAGAGVVPHPAEHEAVAEPEPAADLREQAAQVAALVPGVIASLRPITRVSDQLGITPRMLVVVGALAERPLSVTEQAAVLGVSRPVVADISARLEASGLATRERDERDRRRIRIVLTERGRRLHEEAGQASADDVQAALAGLDPVERDHLLRGLRALARASAA